MIKQFTKSSRLHKTELRQIRQLMERSAEVDGFKIKVYWHVVDNRLTMEFNDFFYYLDGNLIGYLALFTFDSHEAEISALVHPKYRQRRLFKKLLAEATLEMRQRGINSALWVCPQGTIIDVDYVKRYNGQYVFSQVEMLFKHEPSFKLKDLPEVKLRIATQADLNILAKIGAISFDSSYTDTLQRFTDNMKEKNRRVWLASIPGFDNVGKIHVRFDESHTTFIHDLCILPEHRGKKLASAMTLKLIQMMRDLGQRQFILDVECHNQAALKLYELCGFEITNVYDYWRIAVDQLPMW